jgi:hypothetical protein
MFFLSLTRVCILKMGSTSKPKGKRELKNLECSLKFDARGSGSSRRKGKTTMLV